jgi:competence protein ComEC
VIAFGFAGRRVLFTGDIEAAAESRAITLANVRADVLKVPHHGSRTSSTEAFVAAVQPSVAVVSVGLENRFHHPAPEVVGRYDSHSVRLLRTDLQGAVHLVVSAEGELSTDTFRSMEVAGKAQ